MLRQGSFARGACISALVLMTAGPAFAGAHERAENAIAKASAKIDVANKVGALGEVPGMIARAEAELSLAREDLHRGRKQLSFDEATHASMLADTALGAAQQRKLQAERDRRNSAEAAASVAQQNAAEANARAADANARADSAEQAAASAAADAAALRAMPPPMPTSTTVTTVEKSSHVVAHRAPVKKRTTTVVRRAVPATVATEESTTVTTNASGQ